MEQWIRGVGCDPCLIPFLQVQRGEEAQPGSCTGSDVHAVACHLGCLALSCVDLKHGGANFLGVALGHRKDM